MAPRLHRVVTCLPSRIVAMPDASWPSASTRMSATPLDVLVVRKLGVPGHAELAMGAIASGGIQVVDQRVMNTLGISREAFEAIEHRERAELERRERAFRGGRAPADVSGKTAILVDDGLATGASMAAAIDAIRTRGPARVVAAVPVAPPETCEALGERADEMICLNTPDRMYAVGLWYEDFTQTSDAEVRQLLDTAARELPGRAHAERAHAPR
jgi:predicted phosphoribosyltransferase